MFECSLCGGISVDASAIDLTFYSRMDSGILPINPGLLLAVDSVIE